MNNQRDQDYIRKAMPESGLGLLSALPSLRTREAVIVGEGVTVPMRVRLQDLDDASRPRSGGASFSRDWATETEGVDFINRTLERWRQQRR